MIDQDMGKPKIIIICGPTGIGKTAAAIGLASEFKGEIISADSMQIYRQMNIGTAKPTPDEIAQIHHYMIDIVDPNDPFDAALFQKQAQLHIMALFRRNVLPFVVGGTGFYIRALIHGLCDAVPTSPTLRARLQKEAETAGAATLHARLIDKDPDSAAKIHPNDLYRIIRALEVYEISGIALSAHQKAHQFKTSAFDHVKIGIHMDRDALYNRINKRVDTMIAAGLVQEVQGLLDKGYASVNAMQSIGYRHMADYLEGRLSWEEAVRTLKRDTRRYAKRQMTWLLKDTDIHWNKPEEIASMRNLILGFLEETG